MILDFVLMVLYVVTMLAALGFVFCMNRLQRKIDQATEHNKQVLREIGETWERCERLNDEIKRNLAKIERINRRGEEWKGN